MQIGKFIQYSNTDALGNSLTYNNPCKYSAKAIQSNCFHSDTTKNYIAIGNRDDFSDVTTVEMTVMFDNISFTQTTYFFSNLLKPNVGFGRYYTYKNKFGLFEGSSGARYIWTTPFNIEANTPYHLRLSYDGTAYTLTVNGQACYREKGTEVIVDIDNIVRIGTRDYTSNYGLRNASIWNFRCYNSNNELVHHYPLSEGMGKIAYDTIGGKHGVIINAGNLYSVVWAKFQNDYHYNLTNGYVSIDGDDIDRFSKTLKIPLKDASSVLVAKDSYQAGINNYTVMAEGAGWTTYDSSTVTLIKDNTNGNYIKVQVVNGTVSSTRTLNNCQLMTEFNGSFPTTFTSPNLPASYNNFINVNPQIPVQYNLKCKVRCNTYTYDGIDQGTVSIQYFMLNGSVNSLAAAIDVPTDGEWHDIAINRVINSNCAYEFHTGRLFCYLRFRNVTANVSVNIDLDIKDIELYRTSNCTYHPPILNGHNGAETKFDFSQGVSDVSEVRNDLLYAYRPNLITTSDESLGANGSMRSNGWSGAMDTITSAGNITNGLWTIYYNKTGNANNGYIDNYTLTDDELAMMGLSSKGVAAQAIQFTSIGSILSNSTQNVTLYYRVNLSTLFGKLVFPNVLGWSYKVHFTGWVKKLVEYNANLQLATAYQNVLQSGGQVLIPESEFTDNEFHYIDKTLSFYYPNNQNSATSTASHLIGLGAYPSGYTSFTNPDTGAAYTATEANHRPTLALAKVKITFEPQEVYFKDGKGFKLMNFNNMALSRYQTTRQNNQTTFNLS